ncbi:MAG: zinc-ribbon domain-containing protein, partial [Thermodesulfobacteriota bacterium]
RNSSSLKIFRDIPLDDIHRTNYEMNRLEPRITFVSYSEEDRIDFLNESIKHLEGIDETINKALVTAREIKEKSGARVTMFCFNCGSKIPRKSKFCSECGKNLIQ